MIERIIELTKDGFKIDFSMSPSVKSALQIVVIRDAHKMSQVIGFDQLNTSCLPPETVVMCHIEKMVNEINEYIQTNRSRMLMDFGGVTMGGKPKEFVEPIDDTAWKVLDGYFWPYRVHETGIVERLWDDGKWRPIKPFMKQKKKGDAYRIPYMHIKLANGHWKSIPLKNLVVEAFFGGRKPNERFICKNHMVSDCSVRNLCRVTENGNVVEIYSSVTEAAEKKLHI